MPDGGMMKVIRDICAKDSRFAPDSYIFVLEALDFTARMLNKPSEQTPERHVSGQQLLEGIRTYAVQQFGPMAMTVLSEWGVKRTQDFGELVFNLVETGKLRKTDSDTREDFADGYDFEQAFVEPFRPQNALPSPRTKKGKGRQSGPASAGRRPASDT